MLHFLPRSKEEEPSAARPKESMPSHPVTWIKEVLIKHSHAVLCLARTRLIFTGIQEGTQPGGLTPPGQTEPGIPYHVPSCWVPVGGSGAAGTHSQLRSTQQRQFGRAALWVVQFVLCIPLFCIVVVPVPFVCCSIKMPLSQSTGFCLFLSVLLRTPAGGGAATWCFCCRPQPNHNKHTEFSIKWKPVCLFHFTAFHSWNELLC